MIYCVLAVGASYHQALSSALEASRQSLGVGKGIVLYCTV